MMTRPGRSDLRGAHNASEAGATPAAATNRGGAQVLKILWGALGVCIAIIGYLGSQAVEANTTALQELRTEIAKFRDERKADHDRVIALEEWRKNQERRITADSLITEPD